MLCGSLFSSIPSRLNTDHQILLLYKSKTSQPPLILFVLAFFQAPEGLSNWESRKKESEKRRRRQREREREWGRESEKELKLHTWAKLAHSAWGHSHSSVHLTSESSATKEPLAPSTTHPTDAPRSSFIKAQPLTLRETINPRGEDRFKRTRLRLRGCTFYLDQYHFFSTHWPKGFTRLNRKVTGNIITILFACILFMRSTIYS